MSTTMKSTSKSYASSMVLAIDSSSVSTTSYTIGVAYPTTGYVAHTT